ncbi:MAG TPA: tetratricopeptide repeat protein, partial [Pyrinomonadaceae bacterium]|nr:tetratricopeptide repeat protein [Pyrinomonadaceae bacterium]
MKPSGLKRIEFCHYVSVILITLLALIAPRMTTSSVFASPGSKTLEPQTTAQESKQPDIRELKQGAPIERELGGGNAQSYRVMLTAQQYLKLVVEQKGVDVGVSLFAPDGRKLAAVDSDPTPGSESIFVVAGASGEYRVEVHSSNKDAKDGKYEISIEELREATSKDRVRVSAHQAFEEANRLRDEKTAESRRQAIKKYEEALPLFRMVEDRQYEAHTLSQIAAIYELSEPQKSLEYHGQALSLYRAIEDRRREAGTLNSIGVVYRRLGEMQKALANYQQALTLSRALGDLVEEATALHNMGVVHTRLGESRQALEYLQQALLLRRKVGDQRLEAYTLGSIGSAYEALGDLQKAVEYFGQALSLLRLGGDLAAQAIMLNNIGAAYSRQGELPRALEHFGKSLPLLRVAGDRFSESATLDNIGQVYYRLSEFQQALQYFDQALAIRRDISHRAGQATTLNNIGVTFTSLGEPQRALEYFEQALLLHRQVENRREEANVLDNIGSIYFSLGQLLKAVDYHNQSLGLRRVVGDRFGETYALANLGAAYDRLGELQKALEYFDQSLKLSRTVGNRSGEMSRLHDIGSIYTKLRESDKALEYYTEALALSRTINHQGREAAILLSTARLQRNRGNLVEARRQVEDALNIIESTRTKVTNQDLRTSYLASKQGYYEFYVDLLMRLHQVQPSAKYDLAAFGASERARARSLLEILTDSRADIRQGVDAVLLERERSVQRQLNFKSERLTRLLSAKHTEEQEQAARKEVEALLTDYQNVQAEIRTKSPGYAALMQPQPLGSKEIQQLLDKDTLLLEYALGEERSYLWAATPSSISSFELPKRADIEAAARRIYEAITARNKMVRFEKSEDRQARISKEDAEYSTAAAALSRMILGPVAGQLGRKRLLIVSEGALQYIPFGALPIPGSQSLGS